MRRKIEFWCFYMFYLAASFNMLATLHPAYCMVSCMVTDVTFVIYCWVRYSDDELIHAFRTFIYGALIISMLVGAFVENSIVPFMFLGPVWLGYLKLEGGFRHAQVSRHNS